jgi:hypothetical protein
MVTGAATATAAVTASSNRKRRGHRRTVSWSKELQHELSPINHTPSVQLAHTQPKLSPRDEAAQILGEEDSAELKEIFL